MRKLKENHFKCSRLPLNFEMCAALEKKCRKMSMSQGRIENNAVDYSFDFNRELAITTCYKFVVSS
jgi:hypothetical protein